MTNPFKYRQIDPDPDATDWEDNWLSNALAWSSDTILPSFCSKPEHWTSRVSNYLWTSCSCCMFFRGLIFGALVPTIAVALIAAVMYVF